MLESLFILVNHPFIRAVAGFLLAWTLVTLLLSQLQKLLTRREGNGGLAVIVKGLRSVRPPLLGLVVGLIFLPTFVPEISFASALQQGAVALLILQIALIVSSLVGALIIFWTEDPKRDATTLRSHRGLLRFLVLTAIWSAAILSVLANLGFDVTALVTGLGIGGVAIALAVQNILGDLFSSLSIALDRPFEVGDFISVGTEAGTVEQIGIKTTRLRSVDGEQVVISNSDLLGSRIHNFKRMIERRELLSIGIVYETPLEKVRMVSGILKEIISSQPSVRFDRASFRSFGDSSLIFEAVYFVSDPSIGVARDITERINTAILERFTELGIAFAYPTRTVYAK